VNRTIFLTIAGTIALIIGILALTAPGVLISQVKLAESNAAAQVMARTVGVLLITIGILNILIRKHADSATMKSVLIANLVLQLSIMPIDPLAYINGTFHTLGSFVPNTIIHILLAAGFIYFIRRIKVNS
jgi:hypothetical protein